VYVDIYSSWTSVDTSVDLRPSEGEDVAGGGERGVEGSVILWFGFVLQLHSGTRTKFVHICNFTILLLKYLYRFACFPPYSNSFAFLFSCVFLLNCVFLLRILFLLTYVFLFSFVLLLSCVFIRVLYSISVFSYGFVVRFCAQADVRTCGLHSW
jgi:hypothetical protein